MLRFLTYPFVLLLSVAPAFALSEYSCILQVSPNSEAIPQRFRIEHDGNSGRAIFFIDPSNNKNLTRPVEGKVTTDNKKRTTFAWELKNFKSASGRTLPIVLFKATYIKATNKVSFNVTVPSSNFVEDGFGRCSLR